MNDQNPADAEGSNDAKALVTRRIISVFGLQILSLLLLWLLQATYTR